ncbi:hypothetical protein SNK04_003071 [Fusarium graminearum]
MIASLSSSPPTSMPYSTSPDSHIHNTDNMVRSSSAEPAKSSKRKGMCYQSSGDLNQTSNDLPQADQ